MVEFKIQIVSFDLQSHENELETLKQEHQQAIDTLIQGKNKIN